MTENTNRVLVFNSKVTYLDESNILLISTWRQWFEWNNWKL